MRKTPCTNPYVSHFLHNPLPFFYIPNPRCFTSPYPWIFFRAFFPTSCGLFTSFELPYWKGRSPPKEAPSKCSRGSGKLKKIFHILFQERGGHLSYLDAGGFTRGTQLMNMFVVTKFVINDCCLGSITSFFAPSRLFTIFIVIYLYIYSFFSSVEKKGWNFVNNFFLFALLCFLSGKFL